MAQKHGVADQKRFEVLNQMLLERQAEIRARLRTLRETVPAEREQIKDPDELSMEEFVVNMDIALVEMESETLRKIDQAIRRLHEGTYGICAECEEKISEARLKALPFALRCRDCQEQLEGEPARERSPLALEEGLSISARNDRTPAKFEKQQIKIWEYARTATSRALAAHGDEADETAAEPSRRVVARVPVAARASRRPAPAKSSRRK